MAEVIEPEREMPQAGHDHMVPGPEWDAVVARAAELEAEEG